MTTNEMIKKNNYTIKYKKDEQQYGDEKQRI